jgi:arylsulfatase A-like enzyme
VGRVVDAIDDLGELDNTLVIYIAGDNGSSAEGGFNGLLNEMTFFNGLPEKLEDKLAAIDDLGGPMYYNHFPAAWAWAMDTPFQWTKQIASHFGGTQNGMAMSWPARIKDKGSKRFQFSHVIDIATHHSRSDRHCPARTGERYHPEAHRRYQPGLHL